MNSSQDRFLRHRFLTDAFGHLFASYLAILATQAIDPHSDTQIDFRHGYALALAASFIVSDFLVGRALGNVKWFGLVALVVSSIAGYVLFFLSISAMEPGRSAANLTDVVVGLVGISPLFLIPAFAAPLIIRLMAYPIIGVFRPD